MTLTVEFVGICTHIRNLVYDQNLPFRHRVVLVNAGHGLRVTAKDADNKIPPHIPKLIIDPAHIESIDGYPYGLQETGTAGVWRLCGVNLAIEGTDDHYECSDDYQNVPRLSSPTKALSLSSDVVVYQEAACYFDIDAGRFTPGKTEHDAITSVLDVRATDEPVLRVTCFWNGEVSRIRLKPGDTKIIVEHTGYQYGDSDRDYLIHYRVFGNEVPPDAFVPEKAQYKAIDPPGAISVACSNSQYP